MALSHSPSIVTNGLVLNLDAGNRRSYSGSGNIWTDLSGRGNNGTLTNGPTFSGANVGSFAFDGSNDYVLIPNNTALDTQTPTVEVWIRTNATSQNGFWFEKGAVNTQYSLFQEGSVIQWRMNIGGITNLSTTTANFINTSNWYQVVGTYTSGTRRLYINGTLVNSDTQSGTIATNSSGIRIGSYLDGGYFYNGNIAIVRIYVRELSLLDIQQNFNALRGRFGI